MNWMNRFALLAVLGAVIGSAAVVGCGSNSETTETTTEDANGTTTKTTTEKTEE